MVQIPDSVRPYVLGIQKFHFWILAALVPLVLLPLLFMAQAGISQKIESQRSKIKSSLDSVTAILGKTPHPNEKWSEQIGARAREINDETLQVWEQLWKAQAPLRQWPESLGNDFVKAASSLAPNGALKRSLRERYQNEIRPIPRQLPSRMGVDDLMGDVAADNRAQPLDPGQPLRPSSLAQWNGADQQELFSSFDWAALPSTTQVVMAQEELWMYGVLCDVIRKVNSVPVAADAQAVITPANITIPFIQQLKVGYLAAEDDPGGGRGQRILRAQQAASSGGEMPPPEAMMGTEGAAAGRPPHPRFGGGGAARGGMPMGMTPPGLDGAGDPAADASQDDAFKHWVYVDLEGNPLMADALAAAPMSRILRLMPFVLRVTIDQRGLDRLLVELASAPVPIDTRQVRINVDQPLGGDVGGRSRSGSQPDTTAGDRARLQDVSVELRGTVAIVMPPDPSLLKVGDDGGQEEGSE